MKTIVRHKKTLIEKEINPLETTGVDASYDEAFTQAILAAIASETKAWNEYDQILQLAQKVSNKTLLNTFKSTIEDIKSEEMKHIGQLTTCVSQVPELQKAYEAGKEEAETGEEKSIDSYDSDEEDNDQEDKETEEDSETNEEDSEDNEIKESSQQNKQVLNENVQQNRYYDPEKISEIVTIVLNLPYEAQDKVDELLFTGSDMLTANEVDMALINISKEFNISAEQLDQIENKIIESVDPKVEKHEEYLENIDNDLYVIKKCLEDIETKEASKFLHEIIDKLEMLKNNNLEADESIFNV